MADIVIETYRTEHQQYFEQFNRDWIERSFVMEPVDEFVLKQPEEAIIKPGGAILMAICDGVPAGTVGLRKVADTVFEFTKMAVDEKFQRKGIAEKLSLASFEKAKELGASDVILYTNSKQKAAIALYEKLGFKHLPVEPGVYERADIKMTIPV